MIWMITGGTGQLGFEVARLIRLSRPGDTIYAPTRASLDLTDFHSLRAAILDARPDVLVNCAGWTDVDGAEECANEVRILNAMAPEVMAQTLRTLSTGSLVQVSTDYVFDGLDGRAYHENSPLSPQGVYARTKAEGEAAVQHALAERSLIVRTSWLYSSRGSNFVKSVLTQLQEGSALRVVCDQFGHPTWARDAAQRVLLLIESLDAGNIPNGTYHAVNSGVTSWWGLAREIARQSGLVTSTIAPIKTSDLERLAPRPQRVQLRDLAASRYGLPVMRPWGEALKSALPTLRET